MDYRKYNAVTHKDAYPLPNIQDIFDNLHGAKVFTTLDLKSGYWQIPIATPDQPKSAFITHMGLFEFQRMPFGLCNAPGIFQRTMNKVLHGLVGKRCLVYLDGVIVFSKDDGEHLNNLQIVLDCLRHYKLTLKPSKCHFLKKSVDLLGYIVDGTGIRPQPDKVCAIQSIRPPTTVTQIRKFLGMAGYYRQICSFCFNFNSSHSQRCFMGMDN